MGIYDLKDRLRRKTFTNVPSLSSISGLDKQTSSKTTLRNVIFSSIHTVLEYREKQREAKHNSSTIVTKSSHKELVSFSV